MSASYTPAMKAAVCTRYGPPEVVVISEVEKPTTGDNGLLVKVHATTVNRTDCAYRAGKPFFMRFLTGLARPRSTVLGTEFAGVIEAIGSGVTSFGVGDKVFGYNEGPFGAHAEYLSVSEDGSVATMPANVTYQQAAPSTEGSHYALAHIRVAKIRSGQNILDSVGKSSFSQCKRLLKQDGIYISSELGPLAQNPFRALIGALHGGKKVMFPIPKHDQLMVGHFRKLIESGKFSPVIDRTYPLDQIVEAYRYVEAGQKTGNVVISLEGSANGLSFSDRLRAPVYQ